MAARRDNPRQDELLLEDLAAVRARAAWHVDAEWRAALSEAIKRSGKTREQIAVEMEERLGSDPDFPISKATLDAFTAPSRSGWRFPVIYLDAFIEATGAEWLIEVIARKRGRFVLSQRHAKLARVARVMELRDRLNAELREWRREGGRK